jgi:hypothetical protein
MKQAKSKLTTVEQEQADEGMREAIRKNCKDYDFGNGVEVTLTYRKDEADKQGTVTHFFTSSIPKLQIKSRTTERNLEVEMSSVEADNQSLLHFLFKKSKGD